MVDHIDRIDKVYKDYNNGKVPFKNVSYAAIGKEVK